MDFWEALNGFQADVNGDIAAIEAKIRRLQKANSRIAGEQGEGQSEVKTIKKPELENEWKGPRADRFEGSRDATYQDMVKVFNQDYGEYHAQISAEISRLEVQLAILALKRHSGFNRIPF